LRNQNYWMPIFGSYLTSEEEWPNFSIFRKNFDPESDPLRN